MGSGGRGAGWRGVTGAWFGTSTTGAERSQALRTSFWKDKFLPQLQVGATTSWKVRGKALVLVSPGQVTVSFSRGGGGSKQGEAVIWQQTSASGCVWYVCR